MTRRVLVVDDDAAVRAALAQTLELGDIDALTAGSFIEAKDHISADFDGIILSDIRMPGRDGFYLLDYTSKLDGELPVILLTGEGDIPMAVAAMGKGAFGFLEKPCASDELLAVIEQALKTRALVLENRRLKAQLAVGDPAARMLFGTSPQAKALRERVRVVARTGAEVLVTGAPGTGISKVAEVIHLMSAQGQGPFVRRPCAALTPSALIEAFETATGGSLFLDELAAMPAEAQFAALELIEAKTGPRVIAGTNVDLAEAVASGDFNADLFYRLDVMRVRIPSLSERPEDIAVLFGHYVSQASEQAGLACPKITPEHTASLMAQSWPGNARSLMSAAMRFVLGMPDEAQSDAEMGLSEQMARVERSFLIAALGRQNGNATEAAKALQLPRKTFYDKLTRYGIRAEDYRR